jgi:hypothetical protein
MERTQQLATNVPTDVTERLERYSRERGVRKQHIVAQALRHYMAALDELPEDVIIPPHMRLTEKSGRALLEQLKNPRSPTPAMRALFKDKSDE